MKAGTACLHLKSQDKFRKGGCHNDLSSGANGYLIWPSAVPSPEHTALAQ